MTVKPHELVVPVTLAKSFDEAKAKAEKEAVKFFGEDSKPHLQYRAAMTVEFNNYTGSMTVYYDEDENKED